MNANKPSEKRISIDELRTLMLGILDEIDAYCTNNGLSYYLLSGTLLGAVRHQGFIPWDDDIDIAMPRKDYNLFISKFESTNYEVLHCEKNHNYNYPYAKVIDNRTVLFERNVSEKAGIGVFVDVFPIDYCTSDLKKAQNFYLHQIRPVRRLAAAKGLHLNDKSRPITERILLPLLKIITMPWSANYFMRKVNTISQKYLNRPNSKYCAVISVMGYGIREIMETKWYGTPKKVIFEGKYYNAPADTNSILTNYFGDYMKLPPIEKRVSHHDFEAFWK